MMLSCVQGVPGSNLRQDNDYHDLCISWVFSVPPYECWLLPQIRPKSIISMPLLSHSIKNKLVFLTPHPCYMFNSNYFRLFNLHNSVR
jgi:hypothetical protein